MSANSAQNLKSRLRVVPIDVWSTREKLCLASSVLKSGDQNWSSVSRPLRTFGEPNRPNDWFHQKYCAIQYQELLEKIETETPKRKRSERGEETPQTIIVRNLTKQRIEELRRITQMEKELILKTKQDLDSIQSKQMSEKRFKEICNEIKEKETKEKEREVEHKKWLEERDVKIAQMTRKGSLHPRPRVSTAATPTTPVVTEPAVVTTPVPEKTAKSPLNEPLKVEVDSEVNTETKALTPKQNQSTENKLTLTLSSPSTSPLLTSLLQSPTPSTPTLMSPNKTGLSVNAFNRQKPLSQVSSPITPITRRPSLHSSPEKTTEVKVAEKIESVVSNANAVNPIASTESNVESEPKDKVESSKPPKLLATEAKNTTKANTTEMNETNETEVTERTAEKADSLQTIEISDQTNTSEETTPEEEVQVIDSPVEPNEKELTKESPEKVESVVNNNKTDESKNESESTEPTNDNKVTEKTASDKSAKQSIEAIPIKQEIIELNVEPEEQNRNETEDISVKEEPTESGPTNTDDSSPKTPSTRSNKRLRKTPNPITITPTVTRRSRRVAQKDSKPTNDDSTEVSDQSAANTPQAVKKRGSIDDTTETSMSEESMDAKIVAPSVSSETVPNSPASVRTEDLENSKEYRTWKKAIMVNWRLISAHKNASLFSHPVTEAEAKGYDDVVHLPIDLNSIKKRIETGVIRTTTEYERDILLMFQNAIMFNNANHDVHQMAVDMQRDTIATIEEFNETRKHDNQTNESKLRARDRRSNVSTVSPVITETEISGRRKSRGASTDTDSNASGLTKNASVAKKKKT